MRGYKKTDTLDELSHTDREELITLANESDEKDTLAGDEYIEATARWRTK